MEGKGKKRKGSNRVQTCITDFLGANDALLPPLPSPPADAAAADDALVVNNRLNSGGLLCLVVAAAPPPSPSPTVGNLPVGAECAGFFR